MINKERLIKLTQKLISINSENPPGDESRIAAFVKDYLDKLGVKTKIYEFKKRRPNVLAWLGNDPGKKSLLITPHLDTVPAGEKWHFGPFAGKIREGRLYGLGATDCKGNLACAIEAINRVVEEKAVLDYNLIFAATANEESGSELGLIPLLDKGILRPDAAVVLDADDFEIIVTQKGLMHLKIKVQGKRAHGAYPWRGINAIDIAINIIRELRDFKYEYKKNKYLRSPTMNVGTIRGGDKVNVVADWCEFELDFRFLPGMSEEKLLKDIKKIIAKHACQPIGKGGRLAKKFTIEPKGIQRPYSISERHPLVATLAASLKKMKIPPVIHGSEGATVITFFQDRDIPAIATGFGHEGCAHVVDEYATVDSLFRGAKVLEGFLKTYNCYTS